METITITTIAALVAAAVAITLIAFGMLVQDINDGIAEMQED